MRRLGFAVLVVLLFVSAGLAGCGTKKAESSKEAIDIAKSMETAEEKVNYMVSQAKAFYGSKEFQDAVDSAQYILRYLDKDSQDAKDLVAKATEALKAEAQKALEGAKKGLADFGK